MTLKWIAIAVSACLIVGGSAAMLGARGQTPRPGDMTQSRVWVENRSPNEAIPVALVPPAAPLRVQIEQSTTLPTHATRQSWEYRSLYLTTAADPARALQGPGMEGWEAVGILQSGPAGATLLLKRPQ